MLLASYHWDWGVVRSAMPLFVSGIELTALLAAVSMVIGLALGLVIALARVSRYRALSAPVYVFVEIFRTTPLLVQIIWFFWVLPVTFHLHGIPVFWLGVIPLSLNLSAFLSEIFRGGIQSVETGQRDAALAQGMTEWSCMRRIVLPQGLMRSVPLVAATWISLFKDTSLVAVIGIHELMYQAQSFSLVSYRPVETFTVAAVIYFVVTYPQSLLVNWVFERRRYVA